MEDTTVRGPVTTRTHHTRVSHCMGPGFWTGILPSEDPITKDDNSVED